MITNDEARFVLQRVLDSALFQGDDRATEAIRTMISTLDMMTAVYHASAPEGHKCADCTTAQQKDEGPCPACYTSWWKKVHPNVVFVDSVEKALEIYGNPEKPFQSALLHRNPNEPLSDADLAFMGLKRVRKEGDCCS